MGKTLEYLLSGILSVGSVLAPSYDIAAQPAAPASQDLTPPQAPAQKAQMPSDAEIKAAEKEIRDVYKDEYKLTDPAKKKAFADKLLTNGRASTNNAQKYVLLRDASNTLSDLLELSATYDAVKSMKENFEGFNALETYEKNLSVAQKKTKTKEDAGKLAEAYLQLSDDASGEKNYKLALSAAKSAETVGKKAGDASLVEKASDLTKAIPDMEREYTGVKKAEDTLKQNPNDPEANTIVGKYLGFVDNDWDAALKCFSKANGLSKIAEQEITLRSNGYENTESVAQVADLWYEQSNKSTNVLDKKRFATHAFELYKRAQSKATGLTLDKINKRVTELKNKVSPTKNGGANAGLVDLIKLIDLKNAIVGKWESKNGQLIFSENIKRGRIEISNYKPPKEYDLETEFTPNEDGCISLILSKEEKQFMLGLGWPNNKFGFEMVAGKGIGEIPNETTVEMSLTKNKRHNLRVAVRDNGLTVNYDGKQIIKYDTDYKNLSLFSGWGLRSSNTIGIGSEMPIIWHKILIKEVKSK